MTDSRLEACFHTDVEDIQAENEELITELEKRINQVNHLRDLIIKQIHLEYGDWAQLIIFLMTDFFAVMTLIKRKGE